MKILCFYLFKEVFLFEIILDLQKSCKIGTESSTLHSDSLTLTIRKI